MTYYYDKLTGPRTSLSGCYRQAVDKRTQEAADRRNRRKANADTNEGEHRKDNAIGLLATHREAQIRRIQCAFLETLLREGDSTSDAVSDLTPPKIRKNCLGAAVNHLARSRLIAPVCFAVSTRPDRHACPVRVWRLLDPGAARAWLYDHPELSDPLAPEPEPPTVQTRMF